MVDKLQVLNYVFTVIQNCFHDLDLAKTALNSIRDHSTSAHVHYSLVVLYRCCTTYFLGITD